ncbi:DUF2142 domain-containing protein [Cryobacterium sp. TMT2-10]|uniref:DUF2142 domain-containing protein n=1 Tax=Cryobacterium sp. TMT2-10 TaxID=1259244 RepID=UPI00106A1786|nr:DUF2142 domain-containing protein [Cryobacterium sp. TMT2-10]TFD44233.1 DUF2142 domain-containing protein [Cryobacterium sp. TMT2-10]
MLDYPGGDGGGANGDGAVHEGETMLKKILTAALVPMALFIALVSWGVSSPVGSSPDDDFHMASIWCGQGLREGLCEAGNTQAERRVPDTLTEYPACFAHYPERNASCPQKPSTTMTSTNRGNFSDGAYPPFYYAVMSVFAGESIATSILLMRAFNAFLFVSVVSSVYFLIPRSDRGPLVWGTLVSIVPLGMFLVPSVNPSSWAVISAATLWISLLGYYRARGVRRRVALGGIATAMTLAGAGARSDAAVYGVLAMLVVAVLGFEKTRGFVLKSLLPLALAGLSVGLFFSAGQAAVLDPTALARTTQDGIWALTVTNLRLLPELWAGNLGTWGLGWLDTALPGSVWVTMLAMYSALAFWGLQRLPWRKGIALAMVFGSLIVVPMYILVHDQIIVGSYVQPRYVFPLMILLAGVSLVGLGRGDVRLSRQQLMVLATLVSLANAIALHINIRRYVTGLDVDKLDLNHNAEWWWVYPFSSISLFSPVGIWAVGTVSFATAAIAMVLILGVRKRGEESDFLTGVDVTETGSSNAIRQSAVQNTGVLR